MTDNHEQPDRVAARNIIPISRPLHPHSVGPRSIPTLLPPASEAYKTKLIPCGYCDLLVPGEEYDGRNQACMICSVTFGHTRLENWPLEMRWKILKWKRQEIDTPLRRGLWGLIKRLAGASK